MNNFQNLVVYLYFEILLLMNIIIKNNIYIRLRKSNFIFTILDLKFIIDIFHI